jgi:hypothetical protein
MSNFKLNRSLLDGNSLISDAGSRSGYLAVLEFWVDNGYSGQNCKAGRLDGRQPFRYAPERPTTGKGRIARYSTAT